MIVAGAILLVGKAHELTLCATTKGEDELTQVQPFLFCDICCSSLW
jgi:hypothetical protein